MNASKLHVIDNFLCESSHAKTGKESTVLYEDDVKDEILYQSCKIQVNLPLIHCIIFNVTKGNHTEMHCDIGEYATLFYPFDHPTASLVLKDQEIAVKKNRLVLLNCTEMMHMQKKPEDDSIRYSVAFKWRLP